MRAGLARATEFLGRGRLIPAILLLATTTGLMDHCLARAAEPVPATVIIVDSSGSMSARESDGSIKLDAARKTIVEALGTWPAGGELALIAYGHRRTNDCADIETIVPLGPVSVDAVKARLAALRARGKTPLSESLRAASKLLPAEGGDIVLVSDGLETCPADPCAVARDLARAHITVQVIGFGVSEDERSQLQCIADNGGGRYFGAADARGLAQALGEVAVVVAEPAPMPEPPAVPKVAPPTPKPVQLTAIAGALGKIVDAPVRWSVTAADGADVYQGESRALALSLLPGTYKVRADAANAEGSSEIEVASTDAEQAFDVAIAAGRLDLALAANAKSPPFGDLDAQGIAWTLKPLDGQLQAEVPQVANPSLLLAPGRYGIAAALKGMEADGEVEIAAGKATALVLDFQLGSLTLEAAMAADGPPLADDGELAWQVGSGAAATQIEGQARPHLTLKAGDYPVTLTVGGFAMTATAQVVAGAESTKRLVVKGGELGLAARLGPDAGLIDDWRDATWSITAVSALGVASGAPASEEPVVEAQPRLTLMPGTWHVDLQSGSAHAEQDVTVVPEKTTELVVDLGAGRLTLNALPEAGDPPLNIVYSVYALGSDGARAADPTFTAGSSGEVSVILPAGKWQVEAVDETQRAADAEVELGAGKELRLDMSLK